MEVEKKGGRKRQKVRKKRKGSENKGRKEGGRKLRMLNLGRGGVLHNLATALKCWNKDPWFCSLSFSVSF